MDEAVLTNHTVLDTIPGPQLQHISLKTFFDFSIDLFVFYLQIFLHKGSTSRDRPKSAPYPRLKNSKKTSKCQVFSFTVLENRKFFEN